MKKLLSILVITIMFINSGFCQSELINSLEIKTDEVSAEYIFSDKLKCQSTQSSILYKNPGMYSFITGKVIDKKFQTIEHKGKVGSILYFEFDKDAEKGKGFIEGLLLGGKEQNNAHPEEIITKGKVMIILSFPFKSEIGKDLAELMTKK